MYRTLFDFLSLYIAMYFLTLDMYMSTYIFSRAMSPFRLRDTNERSPCHAQMDQPPQGPHS